MTYTHKIIKGTFKLVSTHGDTGQFIDTASKYEIEQTFLLAHMTPGA